MNDLTEKQSDKPKISSRGGKRDGSGRPKGSINKISPEKLIRNFKQQSGLTFERFVNEQILSAHAEGNRDLVSKYILGLAKYYMTDIQQVDHTSNGESLGVQLIFRPQELDDWKPDNN